jgi:hypothetical protein
MAGQPGYGKKSPNGSEVSREVFPVWFYSDGQVLASSWPFEFLFFFYSKREKSHPHIPGSLD